MKKLSKLLLCLIVSAPLFIANAASDKYFIPDAAFRTALKIAYPSCFVADSLIKSCANEAILSNLNLSSKGISSIEGIEHFTNLKSLYCNLNNLTNLPTLPAGLTFIDASENCFCSTPLVKPNGITQENWNVEPNKSSCNVHLSLQEVEYVTKIDMPITINLGKSLFFDGIDDYFEVGSPFPITSTFTIECWMKPTKLPTQLYYGELKDIVNKWNHLAITKIGDSLKVYQNGMLKVSKPVDSNITIDSLVIGLGNNKYSGQMNNLKIWRTIRTIAELKASMVNFTAYSDPDLIGAWNMTTNSVNELKDYSKNANHGTCFGCLWLNEDSSLSYKWSPDTNLSTNNGTSVELKGTTPGIFDYTITATKKNGCKASKELKVIIKSLSAYDSLFLNPIIIGTSFQNPIEIVNLNHYNPSNEQQHYIYEAFRNKDIYYSFTITDSSSFNYLFHIEDDKFYSENYESYRNPVILYDNEYKIISQSHLGKGYRDTTLALGKYYLVISLKNWQLDELGSSFFSAPICFKQKTIDTTIISDAAGACFQYFDSREVKDWRNCHGNYFTDKFYYKITLDAARILKITECGTTANVKTLEIYDHLGNRINFDNEFYGPTMDSRYSYDICYPRVYPGYFIRYLKAGTYYIRASFFSGGGNFILNVSTDGVSCPIIQKATFTKSISAGILDENRTYFSDTKNNNPANGYSIVDSLERYRKIYGYELKPRAQIVYSFQLLQSGIVTISTCKSELSKTLVILNSSLYSTGEVELPWYSCIVDNNGVDGSICNSKNGSMTHYLTAGTYYILSGGHDNSYGNITTEISVDFDCPTCEKKEEPVILGMEDVSSSDNISLYPNPTNGKTFLKLPESIEVVSGKITDLSGKTVQTFIATSFLTEINSESLISGMYYVSFTHQNKNVIKKLMVTK